ncbi:MAG: 2-oxoacid:acceptor oxidoreductase family protein [Myxococcota bacterium]
MEREILLTGIGGQGVQLAAQVIARAALHAGRFVLSLGTYGGSMRGGDTSSTVIVGSEPISSPPIVAEAWAALGSHPRNWGAVRAKLRDGGLAVWDADLFTDAEAAAPEKVHALPVRATSLAASLGAPQAASLVLVGALAGASGLVDADALVTAMTEALPPYRQQHVPKNSEALRAGFGAAPSGLAPAWNAP